MKPYSSHVCYFLVSLFCFLFFFFLSLSSPPAPSPTTRLDLLTLIPDFFSSFWPFALVPDLLSLVLDLYTPVSDPLVLIFDLFFDCSCLLSPVPDRLLLFLNFLSIVPGSFRPFPTLLYSFLTSFRSFLALSARSRPSRTHF